ncbi:uncharacterized protein LOC141643050 [Silene latifolia]|uniref:uncharacterized protein LOC141643050 n=1 Tax=Silene latifolia TaxID=37657 RepID=UPI003D76FB56
MGEQEIKLTLKLLVDKNAKKVMFAEAGKDFVDFLFHIMSLPVGTIVKLIGLKGMVGSLSDLYKSIESLNNQYMEENIEKDYVLNPEFNVPVPLLLLNEAAKSSAVPPLYRCVSEYHGHTVTNDPNQTCPHCGAKMTKTVTYKSTVNEEVRSAAKGYVKGIMTYMVMDNLEVRPLSTISAITLLNKSLVKDLGFLLEKEVQVGLNEGVAILKASLETKAVLSTVFLGETI